ncbi:hypothetical protein C8R44DRAFT_869184 [Mycena epipterygia]|nr:hypothetical protein C8R44DRAFT_869184 [Mycena epipterygia]
MDPLKYSDMLAIEDWDAFKPNEKGYLAPQELALWPDCEGIKAPFLALSVAKGFPATRLTIRDETFAIPISPRDVTFLSTHLGNDSASRYTVAAVEVQILGDASRSSISKSLFDGLRQLKIVEGDGGREVMLGTLDLFKAGSHQLSTAAKGKNHFTIIFVILPIFADSADIRVYATHESITNDVRLPKDCSQSVSAIGMYAGVSDARIEVGTCGEIICLTYHVSVVPHTEPSVVPRLEYLSGALPPLRDAFCCWRHKFNSHERPPHLMLFVLDNFAKCSAHFEHNDATLLCHLAPLAYAYGFKMFIGKLVHTRSTKQEVEHEYKEYFQDTNEINRSELYMSKNARVRYEWKAFHTLGGADLAQPAWLARATEMMKTGYLHKQLMKRDLDEDEDDVEIEDDSCYSAKVIYKHIRTSKCIDSVHCTVVVF